MALKLFNTLSSSLEDFKPISDPVKFFVCGPTVYDYSHLGHAKTYTQFDFIVRSLRYLGYNVTYLVNITDIDDKIINRAKDHNTGPEIWAKTYEALYYEDMQALGNTSVTKYALAHDYIPQIISQVKRLIDKGIAYKISDGYYFDISKFGNYGKLSGRSELRPDDGVSRIDENPEKKDPRDFCLWKFKKEGEPSWETDLGEGRPGWHIEDTAITEQEFGPQYDIHGGAMDLIFPHHEAEIAQMESISGLTPLVRYWLHTGFMNIDAKKMSKSAGNFTTIRQAFEQGIAPLALRYFFLGAHYRSPINFSWEPLQSAQNAYRKLKESFAALGKETGQISDGSKKDFQIALENDLNTPEALAVVWKLVKDESISNADKRTTLLDFDQVLGLDLEHNEYAVVEVPAEVKKLVDERESARQSGEYAKSDELREQILNLGYIVEDTSQGPKISNK